MTDTHFDFLAIGGGSGGSASAPDRGRPSRGGREPTHAALRFGGGSRGVGPAGCCVPASG